MDGGGGLADVPEACSCIFPDHHTIHHHSISCLLGYALDGVGLPCIIFNPSVTPLVPVIIPLAMDRNLLVKRDAPYG